MNYVIYTVHYGYDSWAPAWNGSLSTKNTGNKSQIVRLLLAIGRCFVFQAHFFLLLLILSCGLISRSCASPVPHFPEKEREKKKWMKNSSTINHPQTKYVCAERNPMSAYRIPWFRWFDKIVECLFTSFRFLFPIKHLNSIIT